MVMNGWELALRRDQVFRDIFDEHGVTPEMLKGKRQTRPISIARQEAMYRLRQLGLTYPQIGRRLGGRDHATVIYGVRTHAKRNGLPE
jgi:chromosomal replication initiator protein